MACLLHTIHLHYRYNDSVSYGELFLQNEYEMSVYNLDKAEVAGQRQRCVSFFAFCSADDYYLPF